MRKFLLLLFCLFSCSKTEILPQKSVRVALESEPNSFDPRFARDINSINCVRMLFEGLTRTSSNGKAELSLAKEVTVGKEGLEYIFHLRPSFWSDGQPLTAFDFERSWKQILDPQFPSDTAYPLYVLKNARKAKKGEVALEEIGVRATKKDELVVELEAPVPYFLQLVSMAPFLPISEKEDVRINSGSFLLEKWEHSFGGSFIRNEKHWDASSVKLEKIDFLVASPDTALELFWQKKIDWVGSPLSVIPADALGALKNQEGFEMSPFNGTYFFRVNVKEEVLGKKNPLHDLKVRKALFRAIDREGIANHVLQGGFFAAASLVPPSFGLGFKLVEREETAPIAIDEPIILSYVNTERNGAIVQAAKESWERSLGITLSLEALEQKVFFEKLAKGDYMLAAGSWIADFDDPIDFLEVFKHRKGNLNHTGWENARYIDFLERSQICSEEKERKELLKEAEGILMEELPILPVFHYSLHFMKQPRLKGAHVSSLGILDLKGAYWEEL